MILATVCGEAMGLDPAHVAELMDAMPERVQRQLNREPTEAEGREWLRRLRSDRPGIRAWLEAGARSMARKLAQAGLPDPSDDVTGRDPERVAVPGSDPLERPDRTLSSTHGPVSAGPALNTAAIEAIIEWEAARS
jgi:hypothetical protein